MGRCFDFEGTAVFRRGGGTQISLVEVAEDLTTTTLAPGLLVIHDAGRGGEDNETELTRRQEVGDPLLDVRELNVEAGADHAALVNATNEVNNDLAAAVVVDDLELTNVTVLKHDGEELDDDLRARPDEDLTLAPLLGIADALEAVVQNTDAHHFQGTTEVETRSDRREREMGR